MAKVIAICNQKGGVGKTTTANALGAGLFHRGNKVLYVDMDAQGNLSYAMDVEESGVSALNVITEEIALEQAIFTTKQGDLIPSNKMLSSADVILKDTGKEYKLKEMLEPIQNQYDYIVIDTPPINNVLTTNSLTAANNVIIPAQADAFSLQGIGQLLSSFSNIKKYCNKDLIVNGVLITRFNARTLLTKELVNDFNSISNDLGIPLFQTKIRENTAIKEAQYAKKDIFTYSNTSNGAIDYNAFINELLGVSNG